jgi:hypothetical protein
MKFHALDVMHEVCKRAIRGIDSVCESVIRRNPAATWRPENAAMESARPSSIEMKQILRVVAATIVVITACESSARESTVAVNRAACDQLVEHVPNADVAFMPGKTVDGRDVAPADLDDGPRPQLPDVISILITTELQDDFDLPFDSPLFEADALIGVVTYDRAQHRFTFNGVELGDPEQRLLAAQCRAAMANPPLQ